MIRLIGAAMIALSCSAIGFSMSFTLKRREQSLTSFISAIQIIQTEIVFKNTELTHIFGILSRENIGVAARFFRNVGEEMQKDRGKSFFAAFAQCRHQLAEVGLLEGDCEIISSACRVIGRYEGAAQAEMLTSAVKRLETEREIAHGYIAQKGKLYKAAGISAGIMLTLIIM